MLENRKIVHIDMDAFFAAIEQRDNPHLIGKPVVVGGNPEGRGVVATASYEARRYGIHSAMPCSRAYRLCPDAIFVAPRFDAYREASQKIMEVFRRYSDLVEPLSLDEAYIDVTENKKGIKFASTVARKIKRDILAETSLTASAGVAPNKFIAKVASDLQKPDGLTVITPDSVSSLLSSLPIRKIPGIGKVTERKMNSIGIFSVGDLQRWNEVELQRRFGKQGAWFYNVARGIDHRPVKPSRERKSIGVERTFAEDVSERDKMKEQLAWLAEELSSRMAKRELRAKTLTLKLTKEDFQKHTHQRTNNYYFLESKEIESLAVRLLDEIDESLTVRLLGLTASNFDKEIDEEGALELPLQLKLL